MFCIKCGGKTEFVSIEGDELKEIDAELVGIFIITIPKS